MLHMFNDFLYKGEIPASVLAGVTVLLPKTAGDPNNWGDTRPTTLSSTTLKWFAQLLLLRGGDRVVVLRRVIRHAKDWGVPTWIVKLDVRKAFDSVWQESMGDMIAAKVGGLRPGGGAVRTACRGRLGPGWGCFRRGTR